MGTTDKFESVRFGNYQLIGRIGEGGMAEVFKARALGAQGFEKLMCVKRIHRRYLDDRNFVDMFINEAKIAAKLNYHNIVQVYDLGEVDGEFYMAMEFVHGRDLLQVMQASVRTGAPPPPEVAAHVAREICRALAYAHEFVAETGARSPIIHRDVSPQNVLISYDGQVKLCDFGLAKAAQSSGARTRTGVLKGKFGYLAPEQLESVKASPQSDLWATGVVLFEMLTGRRLFKGTSDFDTLMQVKSKPIQRPSELVPAVPEELDRIVLQALQRQPGQRYQRASFMARDLDLFCAQRGFSSEDMKEYMARVFPDDAPRPIVEAPPPPPPVSQKAQPQEETVPFPKADAAMATMLEMDAPRDAVLAAVRRQTSPSLVAATPSGPAAIAAAPRQENAPQSQRTTRSVSIPARKASGTGVVATSPAVTPLPVASGAAAGDARRITSEKLPLASLATGPLGVPAERLSRPSASFGVPVASIGPPTSKEDISQRTLVDLPPEDGMTLRDPMPDLPVAPSLPVLHSLPATVGPPSLLPAPGATPLPPLHREAMASRREGSGRGSLILAGLVAFSILSAGAFMAWRRFNAPSPVPVVTEVPTAAVEPLQHATPPRVAVVPTVVEETQPPPIQVPLVRIETTPAGAEVADGPRVIGVTPLDVRFPVGREAIGLRIRKRGFNDLKYAVRPSDAPKVSLRLTRRKGDPGTKAVFEDVDSP